MHNAEADAEHVNAALRLRGNYIKSRRQYLEPYCPCNGYRFKKRKVKIIVRDCTNEQLRSLPLVIKPTSPLTVRRSSLLASLQVKRMPQPFCMPSGRPLELDKISYLISRRNFKVIFRGKHLDLVNQPARYFISEYFLMGQALL